MPHQKSQERKKNWFTREESNRWPFAYSTDVLSTEPFVPSISNLQCQEKSQAIKSQRSKYLDEFETITLSLARSLDHSVLFTMIGFAKCFAIESSAFRRFQYRILSNKRVKAIFDRSFEWFDSSTCSIIWESTIAKNLLCTLCSDTYRNLSGSHSL